MDNVQKAAFVLSIDAADKRGAVAPISVTLLRWVETEESLNEKKLLLSCLSAIQCTFLVSQHRIFALFMPSPYNNICQMLKFPDL